MKVAVQILAVFTLSLPMASYADASPSNAVVQRLAEADACSIVIGERTREWLRSLVGETAPEVMDEAREWAVTKFELQDKVGFCVKLRAELYHEGWLE